MRKSNAIVNIEFLAGTGVLEAIADAKRLARQLDVAYVCFKFNEASFSVRQGSDEQELYEKWALDPEGYII